MRWMSQPKKVVLGGPETRVMTQYHSKSLSQNCVSQGSGCYVGLCLLKVPGSKPGANTSWVFQI